MASDPASTMLDDILRKAGETTNSPKRTKALKYLNQAQIVVLSGSSEFDTDKGEIYPWSLAPIQKSFVLKAAYEVGTVSLTNGSTSGTLSDPPAYSLLGYYLKIDDRPEYFIVTAHTGGNASMTLEVEYTGDTGGTLSYSAKKIRYDLGSDILRLVSPLNVYRGQNYGFSNSSQIYGLEFAEFKKKYPLTDLITGVPTEFAEIGQTDNAATALEILFNRVVTQDTKVDFDYVPYPAAMTDAANSYSVLPRDNTDVLVYISVFKLLIDKNDEKMMNVYFKLAQSKLMAMSVAKNKKAQKTSFRRGQMVPRQDQVHHSNRFYNGYR